MHADELQERIAAFPRWLYQFEFDGGVRTPIAFRGQHNRHQQRKRYFFDPLLRLLGGTLAGHRVLDLGCNAGFWSLACVEADADFVLGIDAREMFIEQARLVFEAKGIEPKRYRFEHGDLFKQAFEERFDVVLCLGVLEVTCRPVELFEQMTSAGAELIVIDTGISRTHSSFFEVSKLIDPRTAVDHQLVLVPTQQAVQELAAEFGFHAVPLAHGITDFTGMDDYRHERRLAFICAREERSLAGLPRAPAPSALWWLGRLDPRRLRGRPGS